MAKSTVSELMNVREVAGYLGINEKKVYFLAKIGKIPCTRVTGKWTFPKKSIDRWIEESVSGMVGQPRKTAERSFLLAAGSDDPSLGILHELYESRTRPASLFMTTVGSSGGLQAVSSGVADFATAHVLQSGRAEDKRPPVRGLLPEGALVVELFHRELGLLVPHSNPQKITSIRDLARPNLRMINRQPGSGTRIYLDQELARSRLSYKKISGYESAVSTHMGVGLKSLTGRGRRRLGNANDSAVARARLSISHSRALRHGDPQGSFLYARHTSLARHRRLARVPRAIERAGRVRCQRIRTDHQFELVAVKGDRDAQITDGFVVARVFFYCCFRGSRAGSGFRQPQRHSFDDDQHAGLRSARCADTDVRKAKRLLREDRVGRHGTSVGIGREGRCRRCFSSCAELGKKIRRRWQAAQSPAGDVQRLRHYRAEG